MKTLISSCLIALLSTPVLADTRSEELSLVINPVNATDFEVVKQIGMGPHEFWCAAASFNEARANRSELLPIYIKRPLGPSQTAPGKLGVLFTLSNDGLPPEPSLRTVEVDQPGLMFKSYQARRYCRDAFTRSTK
ncbi:hypothetical protein [Sulfitobacter sabulilitoris]|uniref:Uncharacterized protein n=1 Tax=Sulfitobacter sabulilitoris TaxID=2562655 RepID=A0A5S3PL90_9RHOB|nr:hypothetical protein [Sulfitobacter sabulilitoris]TMM55091.1 hypothetical protein FDT80_05860 [Sulfitobacter sabulilitoris]